MSIAGTEPQTAVLKGLLEHFSNQLGRCVAEVLQNHCGGRLVEASVQLDRLTGLCRLLGLRRAALFSSELDALLARYSPNSSDAEHLRMLIARSVVQLQHFLARLCVHARDGQFDLTSISILRAASGKGALQTRPEVVSPEAHEHYLLSGFVPCLLKKIAALQTQTELSCNDSLPAPSSLHERGKAWEELVSVLDLLGLPSDLRHQPAALVHLELHFRYLFEHHHPSTPAGLASAARLSARDYLLLNGRHTLRRLFARNLIEVARRFAGMTGTTEVPVTVDEIKRSARDIEQLCQRMHLLQTSVAMVSSSGNFMAVVVAGEQVCRYLCLEITSQLHGKRILRRGMILLARLSSLLIRMLEQDSGGSAVDESRAHKIRQECWRFVDSWQQGQCARVLELHVIDDELLRCAGEELQRHRHVILAFLEAGRSTGGIHYISESLCTIMSKLSLLLVSIGEVALYVVVEALREGLVLGMEHQQRVTVGLLDTLQHLCRLLECPLPKRDSEHFRIDDELKILDQMVWHCVTQLHWSSNREDTTASVELLSRDERQNERSIAVEELPSFLAANIRDLLFCVNELPLCAGDVERFLPLNRSLIVELRMLTTGAHALQVHRVARLSAVLAEVHQKVAGQLVRPDVQLDIPLDLLMSAHRQLRSGLNQAAARQEVSSNREIIAILYQWLEEGSLPQNLAQDNGAFAIFRREAEELMVSIEEVIAGPQDEWDINALMHLLHTLKGNARTFSCELVATRCHRSEEALLHYRHAENDQLAVAESALGTVYLSRSDPPRHTSRTCVVALIEELRLAVDLLAPVSVRIEDEQVDRADNAQELPSIPLPSPRERGIVVPAVSLQRMSELTLSARTGCRSMSDVIESCRQHSDTARMSLLADLVTEQERCTAQLDEEIAGSRMISFARLTPRLQRLAARHANHLDKQLHFTVINDDVCADRLLIESLVAPLEHLLRNAIDHGIEPVSCRRACGKPDCGTLTLSLHKSADALVVELRDDGAGIDVDALSARAEQMALPVDFQACSAERLRWIFLPGFSSRELRTEDSGHGIGLAMVNRTVIELGGEIEVESELGQGCCFRLRLPL